MISQELIKHGKENDIDVVGVGGVASGRDAFELILCGAKAVQVGTCHWTEGSSCFERIHNELLHIMIKKGYTSIEDFRGKLKNYDATIPGISSSRLVYQAIDSKKTDIDVATVQKELKATKQLLLVLISIIVVLVAIIAVDNKVLLVKAFS